VEVHTVSTVGNPIGRTIRGKEHVALVQKPDTNDLMGQIARYWVACSWIIPDSMNKPLENNGIVSHIFGG
jgi:hypothetical protein